MNGETILVVDDNKEIVYSISELLKYEGYQVVKAYDGMEALKALETNQIDLILIRFFTRSGSCSSHYISARKDLVRKSAKSCPELNFTTVHVN